MEEHSEETANIIKMIPFLEKDIKDLKVDPKTDLRRQMFPHLFQEVTKLVISSFGEASCFCYMHLHHLNEWKELTQPTMHVSEHQWT